MRKDPILLILAAIAFSAPAGAADMPAPAPSLDRALAWDYHKALAAQGVRVTALAIIDTRARGGIRRADIVYKSATNGTLPALRPEVIRILGPGSNPKLALDQIVVRATGPTGTVVATITVVVADLDRWLKTQISDDEFYNRWVVLVRYVRASPAR
ncbi:MAG: hypothetical protein ACT4P5_02960 [Armatimonadota bacterium]